MIDVRPDRRVEDVHFSVVVPASSGVSPRSESGLDMSIGLAQGKGNPPARHLPRNRQGFRRLFNRHIQKTN